MRRMSSWAMVGRALAPLPLLALAAAQAPAPPPVQSVNGWKVRHLGSGWCSADTAYGPGVHLRLTYDAAVQEAELYVWNGAWDWLRQGETYDVTLRFSNDNVYRGSVTRGVRLMIAGGEAVNGLWMRLDAAGFLDDFAGAATVDLSTGERRLATLSLRGTSAVVQRLQACAAERASRPSPALVAPPPPPIAARSYVGVAVPPAHRVGTIMDDDYPAAAIRAGEQGSVTIEMAVNASGYVTDCVLLASSGSAILDATTCAIAQRRFRFAPATDANGRPVAGIATRTVVWVLPEPDPAPVAKEPPQ